MSKETPFTTDPLLLIPQDIKNRLAPYLDNVEAVLLWQEDIPHQKFHILEGLYGIRKIAPSLGLGVVETDLAERSYRYHDLGYKFVTEGILKPEEHHLGSVELASRIEPDKRVLNAIFHHVDDVLPRGVPEWARLVRDVDRSAIGYPGANRIAIYLDFEHPRLTVRDSEKVIEEGVLCDFSDPLSNQYDKKAKEFFWAEVFPFLEDNNLIVQMEVISGTWLNRFNGVTGDLQHGYDERFLTAQEIEEMHDYWKIEPVMREVKHLFYLREHETNAIWDRMRRLNFIRGERYGADDFR